MRNPLSEIEPAEIARDYQDRRLDELTDAELFTHAVDLIEAPKREFSSFALHAPLEALARFSLLSAVAPEARRLARMQLVALAANYQSLGPSVEVPRPYAGEPTATAAMSALKAALAAPDVEAADAAASWLARHASPGGWLPELADLLLDELGAAAHAPIYVALIFRVGPALGSVALAMARGFARQLAEEAGERIRTPSEAVQGGRSAPPEAVREAYWQGLAGVRFLGRPEGWGIASLVHHAEDAGLPREAMAKAWGLAAEEGEGWYAAFRGMLRAVAHSMLQETEEHAKYGWSHALTIPQAVAALGPCLSRRRAAIRLASVIATAFRAGLGERGISEELELAAADGPLTEALREGPGRAAAAAYRAGPAAAASVRRILVSEASVRNDAHLVKYVLACLDAAAMDPDAAPLYHAAAAHLLAIWMCETPAEALMEALHTPRA